MHPGGPGDVLKIHSESKQTTRRNVIFDSLGISALVEVGEFCKEISLELEISNGAFICYHLQEGNSSLFALLSLIDTLLHLAQQAIPDVRSVCNVLFEFIHLEVRFVAQTGETSSW